VIRGAEQARIVKAAEAKPNAIAAHTFRKQHRATLATKASPQLRRRVRPAYWADDRKPIKRDQNASKNRAAGRLLAKVAMADTDINWCGAGSVSDCAAKASALDQFGSLSSHRSSYTCRQAASNVRYWALADVRSNAGADFRLWWKPEWRLRSGLV
jgi:hypothetical protein